MKKLRALFLIALVFWPLGAVGCYYHFVAPTRMVPATQPALTPEQQYNLNALRDYFRGMIERIKHPPMYTRPPNQYVLRRMYLEHPDLIHVPLELRYYA